MGKRKSSPRLATTSSNDVVTYIISIKKALIHFFKEIFLIGHLSW
jgi:hypothetical protein